jgi:hypothetical protein
MAKDEHIALLKKGVVAWNAWPEENSNVEPDLSERRRMIEAQLTKPQ